MKIRLMVMFFSFLIGLQISIAAESGYPTKPIEILVGMTPGAATDVGARMIAENSKQSLGQEVVVINKPGGSGRLAMTLVSKAKPDGYTLGTVSDAAFTLEPLRDETTPYKLEDFTFIIQFGGLYWGFVVREDSPFRSMKDLVEFARANPHKLTISTTGARGASVLILEGLSLIEGVKIKIVPFSGAAPAITALLGGHVMVATASTVAPYIKAKKIRFLAMGSDKREEAYPEVPTLKELGYPSLLCQPLIPIVGPKNMEKPIVNKLAEAFRKAMESSAFIKAANDLEFWVRNPLSGSELTEDMIRRSNQYREILNKLGINR